MPVCGRCGAEHEILDPTFRRPDAFLRLSPEDRERYARADDDLCRIVLPELSRYFVRGVLPVEVEGFPDGVWWGIWAEVSATAFGRIVELWSDESQAAEPAMEGRLANDVPSYPDTLGLPVRIALTGPTSRPEFRFAPDVSHPFAADCTAGVDTHRAAEWNRLIAENP